MRKKVNDFVVSGADSLMGLYLAGVVTNRTRRKVPYDNPTTEIVTYAIGTADNKTFYVDDYAPEKYFELGTHILVPVYVKAYRKKNGDASYNLCVMKERIITQGESF